VSKKAPNYQTNFSQGEVSDYVEARPDVAKRANGILVFENWWGLPEGGGTRRPGLMFGGEVQDSNEFTMMIPFERSVDDAFVLLFGDGKIRFIKNRAYIESSPGVPYELVQPYATADLRDIHYEQASDFLFMTSLNSALDIQKLARVADNNWTIGNFNADPPPSFEADESLGVIGAPNANTGAAIKFRVGTDQFLAGDVGRQLIAGTGRGIITALDSARQVTVNVLDAFAATITASGKTLTSVGTAVTSTGHGRSVNQFVILTAGAQATEIRQITAVGGADTFTIDAAFSVDQAAPVAYDWTAGFAAGAWLLHLSPRTTLDVDRKEPVGTQVAIVAGVNAFRAAYVSKFIKVYGGLIKITAWNSATSMTGTILSVLDESPDANPAAAPEGSWRLEESSWSATRGRPRTLTIHGGRLVFGGPPSQPTTFNGSDIDNIYNFAVGSIADNAYEYTIQGGQQNPIQWLVSLISLYIGDAKKEHAARGQGVDKPIGGSETPFVAPIDQVGSAHVQPLVVDNAILLLQRFGQDVVQMAYSLNDSPDASAFVSTDLTLFSRHIGDMGFAVHRPAYAKKPFSLVFTPLENGQLANLTFKPREEVKSWSRTKTRAGDEIESVAVVPHEDGKRLTVYVVVKRTINAVVKRFWEYFEDDSPALQTRVTQSKNASGVLSDVKWAGLQTDCAKVGTLLAGATTITGITHLPNTVVDVIIGDTAIAQKTVSAGGVITLDADAGEVPDADTIYEVGLHYDSTLTPLRPVVAGEVTEGLKRSWPYVHVRVKNTIGGKIDGKPLKKREGGSRMYTGLLKMENLETDDPYDGAFTILQDRPYPMTILGISGQVAFGDAAS